MANGVATKGAARTGSTVPALQRAARFLKEAWVEVRYKASWPSWSELKKSTAVVIFAVAVVGIWIGGLDWILSEITKPLLRK